MTRSNLVSEISATAHRFLIAKDFKDTIAAIAVGDARKAGFNASYCAHHGAALIRWIKQDVERMYG